jgi:hypothetical protein
VRSTFHVGAGRAAAHQRRRQAGDGDLAHAAVRVGHIRRRIVSLPPRHLKSHLASAQGCRVATTGVIVLIIHRLHEDD